MFKSYFQTILFLGSLSFSFSTLADLPPELEKIRQEAHSTDLGKSCSTSLNEWLKILEALLTRPQSRVKRAEETLRETFELRLRIHESLPLMSVDCKKLTQGVFARIREFEDYVGAHQYDQLKIRDIDFTKIKAPILEHKDFPPFFLNPKFKSFKFEDGDVLITKGISPISSTITTFTDHFSPFSHIAFVHVDPEKKIPETIESYVGKGVNFFSMIDAMKNENARILVLRAKDRKLALKAAHYMRTRVKESFKRGSYIPYDYKLDFSTNDSLSCEEVAFDSFKTASGGSFIIPEAPSLIKFQNPELTNRVGMKKGSMMMPADMEIDSRFDIVIDWTDYRIIRDSWRKDVMMNVALHATEKGSYPLPENYKTRVVPYIWAMRKVPVIWPLLSKISGIPEDFTPDVPALSIATIASFNQIEANHLEELQQFDEGYFKENKSWAPRVRLLEQMNASIQKFVFSK
jgi:hypothetical protein